MLIQTTVLVEDFILHQLSHEEMHNDKPYFVNQAEPVGMANYKHVEGSEWFLVCTTGVGIDNLSKAYTSSGFMVLAIGLQLFINCKAHECATIEGIAHSLSNEVQQAA